jgi:GxxExxY protein
MESHELVDAELERIATAIVDSAIKVHRMLGPGLLESVYEQCLAHELTLRGFYVERQVPVPIIYEGKRIDVAYRMDLLVEGCIIVECKAVKALIPIDQQQILTHLRLANKRLGFLINFSVVRLKDGLHRIIN